MIYKELKKEQVLLDTVIMHNAGVTREDTMVDRLYAIHFEVMEVFNEVGFFKYWKKKPSDAILEEFVDCIHFALSIGIDHDLDISYHDEDILHIKALLNTLGNDKKKQMKACYKDLNRIHLEILEAVDRGKTPIKAIKSYIKYLMVVGHLLAITEEEVVNNYFDKNKTNYKRVKENY